MSGECFGPCYQGNDWVPVTEMDATVSNSSALKFGLRINCDHASSWVVR